MFFLCRETTKWPLSGHVHINDRCVFCQLKVTLEWWIVVIMPTQTHSIFKSLVGSERFKNRRHQRETMVQTKKAGPKWDINLAWWYGAKMATLIFKWSNEYPYLRSDSGSSIHKSVGGHANVKKKITAVSKSLAVDISQQCSVSKTWKRRWDSALRIETRKNVILYFWVNYIHCTINTFWLKNITWLTSEQIMKTDFA